MSEPAENDAPKGMVWHDEADRLAAWGTLDPPNACMCLACVFPPERTEPRRCPVTAPDLTPEQRQTLKDVVYRRMVSWDGSEHHHFHADDIAVGIAPAVAQMLADARAEERRIAHLIGFEAGHAEAMEAVEAARAEGAARVTAAVEAMLHHAARDFGRIDEIGVPWVTVPEVRAALAEGRQPEDGGR